MPRIFVCWTLPNYRLSSLLRLQIYKSSFYECNERDNDIWTSEVVPVLFMIVINLVCTGLMMVDYEVVSRPPSAILAPPKIPDHHQSLAFLILINCKRILDHWWSETDHNTVKDLALMCRRLEKFLNKYNFSCFRFSNWDGLVSLKFHSIFIRELAIPSTLRYDYCTSSMSMNEPR